MKGLVTLFSILMNVLAIIEWAFLQTPLLAITVSTALTGGVIEAVRAYLSPPPLDEQTQQYMRSRPIKR
jgi:hypothetical protein